MSTSNGFRTQDLSVSIQKKLLGKMFTNKTMAKTVIDPDSAQLMDHLYHLCKAYCKELPHNSGPNWNADKIIKQLLKLIIKITILIMNNQLNGEERQTAHRVQRNIRSILMTIVSFHQVDYSYEPNYLQGQIETCGQMAKQLITNHLSEKSLGRVDFLVKFFSDNHFLDRIFKMKTKDDKMFQLREGFIESINTVLDKPQQKR